MDENEGADRDVEGMGRSPATDPWHRWARRIQALAQNGLTYTEGKFDRERYGELQRIAAEMLSTLGDGDPATVQRWLRLEQGYATPKVDVRGVVFREGRILLVREIDDGRWTLPGGWADSGDPPAEAVTREIREESGFETEATKILAVLDRDSQGHPPLMWPVFKMFILCELRGGEARTSIETSEVAFFGETALPELSLERVLPSQIDLAFQHFRDPHRPTDFR